MANKKAVSALIEAVLLILMTIAAAGVVYSFVLPMIRGNIETSAKCSDASIEIITEGYTCYTGNEVQIQVKRSEKDINISGIQLQISGGGKSKAVVIKAQAYANIKEYGSGYNTALTIPGKSESRTYVIDITTLGITSPDGVSAAPIVKVADKDNLCGTSSSTPISPCS
jgi:FlaG/FlaF family flagellin (archaellin)